ncbi:hypothetical protein S7711_01145 [Stachybotrys chartarum IBT 7711]|uniref:Uncharacterized protein n=1 Tax=Stachybotrys chartarum (strain CBS 109288 / IBT 7711) TaxID=1280523 RepID=A0A084AST8_STACB|nr:hypothetical protein S7711_01145 [Stachybotrys chartarum IBT 7711]KFA48960.1 hypothetical protein S40293_02544 [Stachybotrys chartarum IBT 40293]KFA72268.1 hypothetical protein S40288_02439 [Stachybotrys chartarum IBT 40288]
MQLTSLISYMALASHTVALPILNPLLVEHRHDLRGFVGQEYAVPAQRRPHRLGKDFSREWNLELEGDLEYPELIEAVKNLEHDQDRDNQGEWYDEEASIKDYDSESSEHFSVPTPPMAVDVSEYEAAPDAQEDHREDQAEWKDHSVDEQIKQDDNQGDQLVEYYDGSEDDEFEAEVDAIQDLVHEEVNDEDDGAEEDREDIGEENKEDDGDEDEEEEEDNDADIYDEEGNHEEDNEKEADHQNKRPLDLSGEKSLIPPYTYLYQKQRNIFQDLIRKIVQGLIAIKGLSPELGYEFDDAIQSWERFQNYSPDWQNLKERDYVRALSSLRAALQGLQDKKRDIRLIQPVITNLLQDNLSLVGFLNDVNDREELPKYLLELPGNVIGAFIHFLDIDVTDPKETEAQTPPQEYN